MISRVKTNSGDLRGQIAVVTGGGRGIGRALAQRLARAGAAVAVIARSPHELAETSGQITSEGGRACPYPADVTDRAGLSRALLEIEQTLGPVDLLVNNAGILGPIGPFWESDPDDWWRGMNVNMRGPMLSTHFVLPGMISRGRGRIVNVSSGGAASPITYFSSYVASKTALARFTECIAGEVRPFGISAFSVNPGTVRTSMSEHSLYSPEGRKWFPWFGRLFDEGLDLPPEAAAELVANLASGEFDALSGRFFSPADSLEEILKRASDVERNKLYSLRVRTISIDRRDAPEADRLSSIREEAESARHSFQCGPGFPPST